MVALVTLQEGTPRVQGARPGHDGVEAKNANMRPQQIVNPLVNRASRCVCR